MNEEKLKNYLEILGKWGGESIGGAINYLFVKWLLVQKGKKKETFCQLLNALNHNDKVIVLHIADILGKIRNKQAVFYLKEIVKREQGEKFPGTVQLAAAVALIRLGDNIGLDFLKKKIINPKVYRELRIKAAEALISLRLKNVFAKDEKIEFGGESMTPEWSKTLEVLVNRLRKDGIPLWKPGKGSPYWRPIILTVELLKSLSGYTFDKIRGRYR